MIEQTIRVTDHAKIIFWPNQNRNTFLACRCLKNRLAITLYKFGLVPQLSNIYIRFP